MTEPTAQPKRASRIPIITGRFVALAVAGAVLVGLLPFDAGVGFLFANFLLLVAFVFDWVSAPAPRRIEITRDLPPLLSLRGSGIITWTITNPTRRAQRVQFADELMPSLAATQRRFDVRVPAHATVYAETIIRPSRRGLFLVNEVVVRTAGRLGVAGRQGKRDLPSSIKVYPPFDSRKQAELLVERARVLDAGLRSVRGRGGGTEFEQLREYTIDDDIRRMDWSATVRSGKPIVRMYRAEQNQNVVLLLDTGRVMAGQVDGVPRLEYAMDAMMALATVATRLGDRVGMVAFDSDVRAEVGARPGNSQVARITDAMYRLQPQLVESNYRKAFVHALGRFRRRSLVVLFTELSQHAVSEALAPALPIITRHHVLVVASVTDPDVSTWARAIPGEPAKAFRKAAAVDALAERNKTVSFLRARGVMVVDNVPGKLAAGIADVYLNVKATGRL